MRLKNLQEFHTDELTGETTSIDEGVIDVVKTIMNGKKVNRYGKELSKLHISKAKEEIVAKDAKNPKEKERAKKKIAVITEKIKIVNDNLSELGNDTTFMKSFISKKISIAKNNAKLDGLNVLGRAYNNPDIDNQVKKIKDTLKKQIQQAEEEKKKMSAKDKEEVAKAKKDKDGDGDKSTDATEIRDAMQASRDEIKSLKKQIDKHDKALGQSHISADEHKKLVDKIKKKIELTEKDIERQQIELKG